MALSNRAARKAGIEVICPICGQPTVKGPHDATRMPTQRRIARGLADLSEECWSLTEAGKADLAQWRAEHPDEDLSTVYRQWKAAQEAHE
jgi:hypothetical protein